MRLTTYCFAVGAVCLAFPLASIAQNEWPQFRGPNASGVADNAGPPIRFGQDTNLLWKTEIPSGVSSPIIWGNRVFLTGFANHQLVTLAYDARDGKELWRRIAPAKQIEACHEFSSPAAATPCTDGERIYTYFGSFGLIAYDFTGREIWQHPLERLPSQYGTATSPILAGGNLILQHDGDSTNAELVALSPTSGKTVWRAARPLALSSYSTPMIWRHDGMEELIVLGRGQVDGYGLAGGQPKWWVRGWGFSAVTTAVAGDGMLFVGGKGMGDPSEKDDPLFDWNMLIGKYDANHDGKLAIAEVPASLIWHIRKEVPLSTPGNSWAMRGLLGAMADRNHDGVVTKAEWDAGYARHKDKFMADRFVAIRPGGDGDSTDTRVQWETTRGLPELPSPLFYRGELYFVTDGGMVTVTDPKSGKRLLDRERLGTGGQYVASPIAANGLVYVVNERGTLTVFRAGKTMDVVAVNKLGEEVRCTPAISGNALIVRTANHLWAFAQK